MPAPTLRDLINDGEARIRRSKHVDLWRTYVARIDAEEIVEAALGREFVEDELDEPVEPSLRKKIDRLIKRREAGEPTALIRGFVEFRGMKLETRRGVFTPRPSSELLAEEAIKRLRRKAAGVAVDVACGAGAVALAVAREVPDAQVYGVDIWKPAIKLCRVNAEGLRISNVKFKAGDMLEPLPKRLRGGVDVFTIHPPYVARQQVKTLPVEIRDYEPTVSLTDRSNDGLGLVRRLADEGRKWLSPGGWVLVEVAPDLARGVAAVMRKRGYGELKSNRDSTGATRVVAARFAST